MSASLITVVGECPGGGVGMDKYSWWGDMCFFISEVVRNVPGFSRYGLETENHKQLYSSGVLLSQS